MTTLHIKAGPYDFEAATEEALAPKTCAKFLREFGGPDVTKVTEFSHFGKAVVGWRLSVNS